MTRDNDESIHQKNKILNVYAKKKEKQSVTEERDKRASISGNPRKENRV